MLYSEIIAVCSEIHTKHTVWAERRIVNVKLAVHIVTTGLWVLLVNDMEGRCRPIICCKRVWRNWWTPHGPCVPVEMRTGYFPNTRRKPQQLILHSVLGGHKSFGWICAHFSPEDRSSKFLRKLGTEEESARFVTHAGCCQPTRSARGCIQTLAQSVLGDAAVQVVQWRRTGRAAGVTSSESEDRDRQSWPHDSLYHPLRFLIWPLTFLPFAERARSVRPSPIAVSIAQTSRCVGATCDFCLPTAEEVRLGALVVCSLGGMTLTGENRSTDKNLFQCHSVRHWYGLPHWEPGDWKQSNGLWTLCSAVVTICTAQWSLYVPPV